MVSAHAVADEVVLFSSWFCPFAQRAWIALEEKGLLYKYVEVDPYAKPPELMAVNPRGLVPALQHGSRSLYESTVLLEYIEEAFPGSSNGGSRGSAGGGGSEVSEGGDGGRGKGSLLPEGAYERALVRLWIDHVNRKIVPTFYRYLQRQDGAEQQSAREELLSHYRTLSAAMLEISDEGPFLLGSQLSLFDIALVPWVIRHDILHFYRGFQVPSSDPSLSRFLLWSNAVQQLPSVRATLADSERLRAVYQRYADNSATSQVALAINQGKALP